jgi:hypothetical protein
MHDFDGTFSVLLHAANLRQGTDGCTSPPKEGVLRIFSPLKIRRLRPGFEPANLGTKGQHATPRPSKPLYECLNNEPSTKITKHISSLHDTQVCFFKLYNIFWEEAVNEVPLGRDYHSATENVIVG